ncbi:MAG: NAD(+)/NADH kinase [Planctomycetota bacterium]|jgi:NAD+ kinase
MSDSHETRIVIFGDAQKGNVADAICEFEKFVEGKARIVASCGIDKCTPDMLSGCEFAVVFGGDGSIISAARDLSEMKVPVIGVNLGKLGFLAEFSLSELKRYFSDIIAGKAAIESRMMINCSVVTDGKERFSSAAINDVFITAGEPFRMIELQISVDGERLAGCTSDGLIISTPTGSTAYNLSAGGPIISGAVEAMVISPICPHSLSFRPIVIKADSNIEVVGLKVHEDTTLSIDGQISLKLSANDVVTVGKHKGRFLVVNNPVRTQWDTLATKLGWAEKLKYKNARQDD